MLAQSRIYELAVRPLGRSIADEYYHQGNTWIEGREGNTYTIQISNNSPKQTLFIVSVDGLDVLAGQPAGPASQGYVLAAGESLNIPGWRLNDSTAAEFYFSRTRDSYVNTIGGSTINTGVIGAMVFTEKVNHLVTHRINNQNLLWPQNHATTSSLYLNDETVTSQNLGTGFGNQTQWQTNSTHFEKNLTPAAVLAIYYNSAKNLERMGIQLRKKRDISYTANPFPNYTPGCSPPPDWKG
jgi:hypothetical protein